MPKNKVHPGTGKLIEGWQYDKRSWPSEDNDYTTKISALTNVDLSEVDEENFQSGIGSGEDCKVKELNDELHTGFIKNRIPKVNHGAWFDHSKEYYLYSDYIRSQYPLFGILMTGLSYVDMAEFPKEGVPITARTYTWDADQEEYATFIDYKKQVYFTGSKPTPTSARLSTWNPNTKTIITGNIDDVKNEFVLLYEGYSTPRIVFNKDVIVAVGENVVSGANLLNLEEMGLADGSNNQIFHTKYSPLDKTQDIEVFTYTSDINTYQEWTVRLNEELTGSGFECKVDSDLGIIQFGNTDDGDVIPPDTAHVLVRYSYTVDVSYETPDTNFIHSARNKQAEVNPMLRFNDRGFIFIGRSEEIPASISLEADAELISLNSYGPADIGNALVALRATVLTGAGNPVEHARVTFELLDTPNIGNFTNGIGEIDTFTNESGVATGYYNTPNSIDDVSEFIPIAQYATSAGNTILTTQNIKVSTTQREVFLYSVWKDDPFQGIDIGDNDDLDAGLITPELSDFYKDFFTEDEIYGPTGLDSGSGDPSGALQTGASWWENRRRLLQALMTPTSYNRALRNGRKQIIAHWDATALDPHYDLAGAFVPLAPTTIVNIGPDATDNTVQYTGVVLTAPGTGDLDGYLLISPSNVSVRAFVYDEFSDKIIYSNTIDIQLRIPPALNGTVYIDDFNNIPANTVPYVLNSGDNGKMIPLGFKIRQTGVTLASAIQGVTYLDINEPAILNITFNIDKIE